MIVIAPPQQLPQQQDDLEPTHRSGYSTQKQFRNLLAKCDVKPSEAVMMVLMKNYASSVSLVDTPEQARNLYSEATLLPRSATQIVLQNKGVSVADIFRPSDASKAVLLHAYENGSPRILKGVAVLLSLPRVVGFS